MKRYKNEIKLVFFHNLFIIVSFSILIYFLNEWWLLFMLLGLASSKDEPEEDNTND